MAENLNFNVSEGGSYCYDNQASYCDTYGRLYEWAAAMVGCPSGWHLPTQAEWNILIDFAGSIKSLKATTGWLEDRNGLDTYGFTILPGGYSENGDFSEVGWGSNYWSATYENSSTAFRRFIYEDTNTGWSNDDRINYLASVRCIHN
jgi:uncharacterized protein (TIGR02145 family)